MEIYILAKRVLDPMEYGVWVYQAFPGLSGGTWWYFDDSESWKDHVEGPNRFLSGLSDKPDSKTIGIRVHGLPVELHKSHTAHASKIFCLRESWQLAIFRRVAIKTNYQASRERNYHF
jgi:hypothetical protein